MAGLTVSSTGRIYKDGLLFRNIGVNHPNAIFPIVTQTIPTGMLYNTESEIRANLSKLKDNGIKVIRCRLFPDLPNQWTYGVNAGKSVGSSTLSDRLAFYLKVDTFLLIAAEYDIGCIFTLFQRIATLPDLFGVNVRTWLTSGSSVRNYAQTITQEVVTRYLNNTQVYGWEISNEVNNYNNNKPTSWHSISTSYGTASSYSAANDNFNDGEWATVVTWWNGVVQTIDPNRPRMTGNGPCQYWKVGGIPWVANPLNQFYEEFVRDNATNAMSIHYYGNIPYSSDSYKGLETLLVGYRHFARNNKSAFIVGEYGMQARTITNITKSGSYALATLSASNEPINCDIDDVIDIGYAGDWDGRYRIKEKQSTTVVTLESLSGVYPSVPFSGLCYFNNLYSKFERMTEDVINSGVDIACVWTYLTENWSGHSMESLSDPYNTWMWNIIKKANNRLLSSYKDVL